MLCSTVKGNVTKAAILSSEILHVSSSPDYTNNCVLSGYDQIMDFIWNSRSWTWQIAFSIHKVLGREVSYNKEASDLQ